MKNLIRSLVVLAAFTGISAQASGWGVLGGANFYNSTNSSVDSKAGLALGMSFEGAGPFGGFEVDALYVNNKNAFGNRGVIQVPVMIRFGLIPIVSLGVGGYVSYAPEEILGTKRWDAGAIGSLRAGIPVGPDLTLTAEGRFLFGLVNQSDIGGDFKNRSVQALAGLQWTFPSGQNTEAVSQRD